ncbi:MAG: autotransporter-associated beta strand repeat-containing protein [Chthoniobacterales bacterium]
MKSILPSPAHIRFLVTTAALLAIASSALAQELITNGNFSNGLTNWTTSNFGQAPGQFGINANGPTDTSAASGNYAYAGGSTYNLLMQDVTVTTGNAYRLTFLAGSKSGQGNATGFLSLRQAALGNYNSASFDYNPSDAVFGSYTVDFVAGTSTIGVWLRSDSTYAAYDNVSVTPIASVANALNYSSASGYSQISSALTGSGKVTVNAGTGGLALAGANTHTGGTEVTGGTLFVTGAGTLGATGGAVTVSGGGILDLRNQQTRTGTITMTNQDARIISGDVNNPGSIVNNGGAFQFGGGLLNVPLSGSGGMDVTGGGSIDSSNSYTGVTTISGTTGWYGANQLFVANANALGAASGDLTISGGTVNLVSNTITRSGNVTISGGTLINGTLEKTGGVFALQGGDGSIAVRLAGTAGLTKSGVGTSYLWLSNSYTGATTISGGTLVTDGAGQLTAGTTLAISNGATWQMTGAFSTNGGTRTIGGLTGDGTVQTTTSGFTHNLAVNKASGSDTFSGVIAGSGALVKQGGGTLALGGANTYTGGTTISAGTLQVGLGGANTTGSLGGGNIVNNGNLFLSVSNTLTITNQISGTGTLDSGSLTTVLSGSNSYSGLTTVSAGILRVDNGNALGSTNAGTVVANGAQLRLQGVTVGNEALTISGNGAGASAGALRAGTGANAYGGKVTLAADSKFFAGSGTSLTLDVASGDVLDLASFTLTVEGGGSHNVNDAIVGTGGITKIGSGTITLLASNSYSGATDVQAGRLTLSGNGRLGSGAISISNASTGTLELAVTGTNVMVNNISGDGALFSSSGETRFTGLVASTGWLTVSSSTVRIGNGGASGSFSGNTTLSDNTAQLVFDRSDAYTYIGTISGSGSVTKSGAGTTTLTGSNNFTGALAVNSGVLDLNASTGAAAAAASTISVATNAILLVSKSDQVNNSAAVTLSGGTIQRASGVSEVFGDLNITAASFLDFGSGTAGNLQFQSYTNTGSALVTVQNFFQGNSLQFASATFNSGNLAQFSFGNGYTTSIQGDYFTITAIPEPSTLMAAAGLLGLMLLPACCRQWRRVRFSRTVLAPSLNKSLLLSAATRSPQ